MYNIPKHVLISILTLIVFCLTSCGSIKSTAGNSGSSFANNKPLSSINDPQLWKKSSNATWATLQHTPLSVLQEAAATNTNPTAKGWLTLAIISKKYSTNTSVLVKELMNWRATYPSHPGNSLIPSDSTLNQLLTSSTPKHIAILLPLSGPQASSGQAVRSGFLSAYYGTSEKPVLSFYDTALSTDMVALYQKASAQGADLVIGPLIKNNVQSLSKLNHFDVPVLALNYTPSSFFSSSPSHFYEFGLSPLEEAQQLANKAKLAGLTRALIIASDDTWGHRVTESLTSSFKNDGGSVIDSLYFTRRSNLTQDVATLLHINPQEDRALMREDNKKSILTEQRRQDFDVIFLFANADMARQIVPLLRFYYAGNVPTYSISAVYSGRPNPIKDKDINGVTFSETPWLIQMAHFSSGNSIQFDRLYAIGRDAYLLSHSLAQLNTLPNFPIYGATGAIEMDQQNIHQRLPMVTMHGGRI